MILIRLGIQSKVTCNDQVTMNRLGYTSTVRLKSYTSKTVIQSSAIHTNAAPNVIIMRPGQHEDCDIRYTLIIISFHTHCGLIHASSLTSSSPTAAPGENPATVVPEDMETELVQENVYNVSRAKDGLRVSYLTGYM